MRTHTRDVSVTMTLTAPGCGMGEVLVQDVKEKHRGDPHRAPRRGPADLRSAVESVDDVGGRAIANRHDLVVDAPARALLSLMKRLLLLRHGEAEPERLGLAEFERPLSARGRLEALEVAQLVRGSQLRLDLLLASPALRVRESADIVAAQLDMPEGPRFEPTFYLGPPGILLKALRRCSDRLNVVLLIAHNPGLSELASRLSSDFEPCSLCTCGLARLDFAGSWSELADRSCAGALLR